MSACIRIGLVHVSQIADRYIRDPNEVVTVGMCVKVTVQSVDLARGRIALTMRKDPAAASAPRAAAGVPQAPRGERPRDENALRTPGARPSANRAAQPAKPAPKAPVVPTKGTVAPNGMRFK